MIKVFLLSIFLVLIASEANATMSAASCVTKIKAAYAARTGQTVTDGLFNTIVDLCQGIIDEITANARVQPAIPVTVSTVTGLGATTATGTIQ